MTDNTRYDKFINKKLLYLWIYIMYIKCKRYPVSYILRTILDVMVQYKESTYFHSKENRQCLKTEGF